MRLFFSTVAATAITAQTLVAQDCQKLCDYDFWRAATVETLIGVIEAGEDVNAVDEYGFPVFSMIMIMIMSMNTAEFLLYNPQGDAVVEQARLDGLVVHMLDSGVDITTHKEVGTPYLHSAAQNGSVAVVQRMIDVGAPITEVGRDEETALHLAAAGGDPATMQLLLEAGLDLMTLDQDDKTPLHYAAQAGHQSPKAAQAMSWLIAQGADVNAPESRFQQTPLMIFLFKGTSVADSDFVPVVKAAIESGYSISQGDHIGSNLLHYAAWVGKDADLVRYLIDQGADISVQNEDGKTAYDFARDNPTFSDADIIDALKP